MKYVIVLISLIFLPAFMTGQVTINEDEGVTRMMAFFEENNRSTDELYAWRIQVLATTDRRLLESTRTKFRRAFPHLRNSWSHEEPYYQLKAGAFATKIEALPHLDRIKKKFSKAYLVRDYIKYSEILR